ncbi:hypothetical protein [Actinomadura formosensis]|uniref:hypothetical protein n=1 Tax=Actinomadura formosensis TaxID=60706 RepID=UPI0008358877|nr:hypothetical protein [Actinomadura formosensis]
MLASACLTLLSLPTATTYTHLFGEQVSMRIDRCEHQTRFYECHGSWTDVDGKRHTTTVSHVGPKDIGRTVEARLGPWPMNAHAGSLWADAPIFLPVALMAIGVPGYLFLRWRFGREVKETARRLLDAPDHFLVLEVNHAGAVRPDGEEHLRTRSGDPELPVPAWADRRHYVSVRRPDGQLAFIVERLTDEIQMLDADGHAETVVPHLALQAGRPRIERPDGTLLGEMALTRGETSDVYSIVRPDGREVGRFARLRRHTWALCLAPDCSPVLTDSVLAYLFTEGRAA